MSSTFVPDQTRLIDALDICSRLPINGVELGSNHCFEGSYPYLPSFNFNYLVHNYFPIPRDSYVVNVASADATIRRKSVAHVKSSIDFSWEIGAELYTFHPGFLSDPLGAPRSEKKDFDFQFHQQPDLNARRLAENQLYRSLDEIVPHANSRGVAIAVETEGSANHHNQLLMQTPYDYDLFKSRYSPDDLGVNLNLGHLYLASKTFSFDVETVIASLQDYLLAMELSHNEGEDDSHMPLVEGAWYWPIILRERFLEVPKILEFREVPEVDMLANIALFRKIENEQS